MIPLYTFLLIVLPVLAIVLPFANIWFIVPSIITFCILPKLSKKLNELDIADKIEFEKHLEAIRNINQRKEMSNYKNMKGVKGTLIATINGFSFRVYDDNGDFNDYKIAHYDLEVTIEDSDCFLYDNKTLDYSKETLGRS